MPQPKFPSPYRVKNLTLTKDAGLVRGLYVKAADYVRLETGSGPDKATTGEFFTACPPGGSLATSHKLGLTGPQGDLIAIADLALGFPEPGDAYLGLMVFDPAFRGQNLGPEFLAHIIELAKSKDAKRLFLAVLDENKRGLAFWQRMGFRHALKTPATQIGGKTHIRHRLVYPLNT